MRDRFTLETLEFFVRWTRTRFPFRYGIASMTEVPQLFLRARIATAEGPAIGVAAEGLPPKWFTKNPATTFEQDLPEMLGVIRHAAAEGQAIAATPVAFFDFWQELTRRQGAWALAKGIASLLASLGVSLVERVVLDALCRAAAIPLHRMVREGQLRLRLGEIYPELNGIPVGQLWPEQPLDQVWLRHTVGLGDPLTPADIPEGERVNDGLPQDLESAIREGGLRYFKLKLGGQPEQDLVRLRELHMLLERTVSGDFFITMDGNENFPDLARFREFWQAGRRDQHLARLWQRVLVIEQPVHRARALDDGAGAVLLSWTDHPPMIIDESDGALGALPRALALGYAGVSHKNCKGIVKGLANAALIGRRNQGGHPLVLTGEDLCNLGPVALLHDLAMMALLGIEHVERNGHHYYRGLSMFPASWGGRMLAAHADLYTAHAQGFPRLQITGGQIALASVNAAPFGLAPLLDPAGVLEPLP